METLWEMDISTCKSVDEMRRIATGESAAMLSRSTVVVAFNMSSVEISIVMVVPEATWEILRFPAPDPVEEIVLQKVKTLVTSEQHRNHTTRTLQGKPGSDIWGPEEQEWRRSTSSAVHSIQGTVTWMFLPEE